MLATYITTSTTNDLQDTYHVVRYLKGTPTLGLTFSSNGLIQLFSFIDASYSQHADAKGQGGMTMSIGPYDASFYSKSRKIKLMARSSTEDEIQALDSAVYETV